jgi:transcriptional regulator with XRE-family HTH domain
MDRTTNNEIWIIGESMTFNEQLTTLLKSQNKTQIAHHVGVTRDAVTKWCSGRTEPNVRNLVRLCKYLYGEKWALLYLELSDMLASD